MHALVKVALKVSYPESYPDVLPELYLSPVEGDLEADEMETLGDQLKNIVSRNSPTQ